MQRENHMRRGNERQKFSILHFRKLNLDHPLVKQTRLKHRKVLCVVASIARTTQDCVITTDIEEKGSEEVDLKVQVVCTLVALLAAQKNAWECSLSNKH
jgi:hypothetical protein